MGRRRVKVRLKMVDSGVCIEYRLYSWPSLCDIKLAAVVHFASRQQLARWPT